MTPIEEQTRGQYAAELLENSVLKSALKAIHYEIAQQWLECPARDAEGKEALWQLAKTAQKFERILTGYVETGRLATENMKKFDEKRGFRDALRRIV